jgi:hypothetical protein
MQMATCTIEAFNNMVPLINRICISIIKAYRQIAVAKRRMDRLERTLRNPEFNFEEKTHTEAQYEGERENINQLISRLQKYVKEIEDLGGTVMEMQRGVVMFPFVYRGYRRYICYCPEDIGAEYFINADERFSERRRII